MRSKVEEARSSMQAAKSKGKVIDALMQMKKNGQLPGVYGRLSILKGTGDCNCIYF
jgi:structural maintenance of chromosome 4